jgi:hypothetical protein
MQRSKVQKGVSYRIFSGSGKWADYIGDAVVVSVANDDTYPFRRNEFSPILAPKPGVRLKFISDSSSVKVDASRYSGPTGPVEKGTEMVLPAATIKEPLAEYEAREAEAKRLAAESNARYEKAREKAKAEAETIIATLNAHGIEAGLSRWGGSSVEGWIEGGATFKEIADALERAKNGN